MFSNIATHMLMSMFDFDVNAYEMTAMKLFLCAVINANIIISRARVVRQHCFHYLYCRHRQSRVHRRHAYDGYDDYGVL